MKKVYAPGVFDVIHIGHLNYLKAAKMSGNYLIVGVQEDRTVERAKKTELVNKLPERIAILEQFRFVDEVISYIDVDQSHLLSCMNIDIFACGEEYGTDPQFPDQRKTLAYCEQQNIEIFRIPRTHNVSSTSIRDKLRDFWSSRAKLHQELPAGVTVLGSFDGNQQKIHDETLREKQLILDACNNSPEKTLLDLGCGDGRLLCEIAPYFQSSTGVDFSEDLIELARTKLQKINNPSNLIVSEASSFKSNKKYDYILLSGLIPCLDDEQFSEMISNLSTYSHPQSKILIRTSISLGARINVINQFSKNLNTIYTAYYRPLTEIIKNFTQAGWTEKHCEQLYQNNPETAIWWLILEQKK